MIFRQRRANATQTWKPNALDAVCVLPSDWWWQACYSLVSTCLLPASAIHNGWHSPGSQMPRIALLWVNNKLLSRFFTEQSRGFFTNCPWELMCCRELQKYLRLTSKWRWHHRKWAGQRSCWQSICHLDKVTFWSLVRHFSRHLHNWPRPPTITEAFKGTPGRAGGRAGASHPASAQP